jgi:xanthine dehydrogenase YagT iron-sulfur-binding subunit
MTSNQNPTGFGNLSRRGFFGVGAGGAALSLLSGAMAASAVAQTAVPDPQAPANVDLRINGQEHRLSLDTRTSLLDTLRDHVGLTGTKKGCDHGQCGACTVLMNGAPILSCMTFAVMAAGHDITTVEGLANPTGELHPMQQAFIDQDAFQCGYCTPGQIMSAIGCVNEGYAETEADIREYMSGNLCRCAAYPNIVAAVRQAKANMRGA